MGSIPYLLNNPGSSTGEKTVETSPANKEKIKRSSTAVVSWLAGIRVGRILLAPIVYSRGVLLRSLVCFILEARVLTCGWLRGNSSLFTSFCRTLSFPSAAYASVSRLIVRLSSLSASHQFFKVASE